MLIASGWTRKKPVVPPNRHVKPVRVRFTPELQPFRNASIVAAQLKLLAINTDGLQAAAGAFDAELSDRGMRFRFTSDMKRNEFKGRIQNYLSSTVTKRITFSA